MATPLEERITTIHEKVSKVNLSEGDHALCVVAMYYLELFIYHFSMIYLASDHRGFALKNKIKSWLEEMHLEFVDCGATAYNESDDYPDFVAVAAEKVAQDPVGNRAIILGATGQGEAMVANRRHGVRAIVFYGGPVELVRLGRLHNAANALSLGAAPGNTIADGQPMSDDVAKEAVSVFLSTEFVPEERHVRRINKLD
jgi:ribose 5-phosphate isomerase B